MELKPLTFLVGYGRGTRALASGLERAGLMVRSFDRFSAALGDVGTVQPELVLVGDAQVEGSSLQLLTDLKSERFPGMILYLSHSTDPRRVSQVLEAGAHDVVGPPHSVGAILLRRHVLLMRKEMPLFLEEPGPDTGEQISLGSVVVDTTTREVTDRDAEESFTLSGRELELLVRLMEARGGVVGREELLSDIWGDDQESEAVLDATVHRLRKRLEEHTSRPDYVTTVRGVGYRVKKD